jgi:micrococcal nuclease
VHRALLALLLAAFVAGCGDATDESATPADADAETATVNFVIDGDTIALTDRTHVRLVQIDAPEREPRECYYRQATRELARLLPHGTKVTLQADPKLDSADEHGRLLRYVLRGKLNANLELVRLGAAKVYFFFGARGRFAEKLLQLQREAREARRGLWGACGR